MFHASHPSMARHYGRVRSRSSSMILQRQRVIAAARRIESDHTAASLWFDADPIRACGGYTARQLVAMGRRDDVLRFLASIL
jgi:hypothetical protein